MCVHARFQALASTARRPTPAHRGPPTAAPTAAVTAALPVWKTMLLPRVLLRPTASPALLPLLLSMRPTEPAVGTVHIGTVTRIETYGAFCSLEGVRRDGLLHISQMDPDGKRVPSVTSVVSIGDRLRVRVKSLEEGKIGLTVQGVTQPAGSRMRAQYEQSAAGLDALGPPPTADELERLPSLSLSFSRSSGSGEG